jgi:hypothetical protein
LPQGEKDVWVYFNGNPPDCFEQPESTCIIPARLGVKVI